MSSICRPKSSRGRHALPTTFTDTSFELAHTTHEHTKVLREPSSYYQPLKSDDGPSNPEEIERPGTARGRRSMEVEPVPVANIPSDPQTLLTSRKVRPKSAKGRTRPMLRSKRTSFDDEDDDDDLSFNQADVLSLSNEASQINPTLDPSQHWSTDQTASQNMHHHLMYRSSNAPNAQPSYSSSSQLSLDPASQDTEVIYSEDAPNV